MNYEFYNYYLALLNPLPSENPDNDCTTDFAVNPCCQLNSCLSV